MWWKLLLNKWVIGGVAILGIAGATYLYGRDHGFASGFDRAYDRYQIDMEEIYDQWEESINQRDAEWNEAISLEINKLQKSIEQNQRDREREKELLAQLSVIETRFQDVDNEIQQSSELGTCNLSGEFDSLLDGLPDGPTAPSGATADESSTSPGDS